MAKEEAVPMVMPRPGLWRGDLDANRIRPIPCSVEFAFALGRFGNYNDAGFSHVKALTVTLNVVPDFVILGNLHVLVDNRVAHLRVTTDIAIIHHDRIFDVTEGVDENRPAQHRVQDRSAGHDTAL